MIGATLPGTPAVALGRNRSIAWGMTNVGADVEVVGQHLSGLQRLQHPGPARVADETVDRGAGDAGVGALAGKSTVASLLYFVSLAVLWVMWRDKAVDLKKAFYIGLVLGVLGVIGTFPTFFQMFAA